MTPSDGTENSWIPYAFGGLQTIIAAVLGYISKLLRDIRNEISEVKSEVAKHEILLGEAEKRTDIRVKEVDRRLEHVERNQQDWHGRGHT